MCMREPRTDLRTCLHCLGVLQLAGSQRLAEGPAGDVLVGDVDMPRVAREGVGAQAARVAQAGRRRSLALRAGGRLPLPRDDLQRDVQPRLLVPREPDGPRST